MRGIVWIAIAFVLCAACKSEPETVDQPLYRSGSRIRARVLEAGGARMPIGWHDKQLRADCAFAVAGDGQVRCLPVAGEAIYSDPECSQGAAHGNWEVSGYVIAPATCDEGARVVFRVDMSRGSRESAAYRRERDGTCTSIGSRPMFPATAVDPTTFVHARVVDEKRGARFATRMFVTDDGARVPGPILDASSGRACTPPIESPCTSPPPDPGASSDAGVEDAGACALLPKAGDCAGVTVRATGDGPLRLGMFTSPEGQLLGFDMFRMNDDRCELRDFCGGTTRCVTRAVGTGQFFTDGCTRRMIAVPGNICTPTSIIEFGGCPDGRISSVLAVGERLSPSVVLLGPPDPSGRCLEYPPSPSGSYFAVGEPIAIPFPAVSTVLE